MNDNANKNKIDLFEEIALPLFKVLIDKYGYVLSNINTCYSHGSKNSMEHIYSGAVSRHHDWLKIRIEQAPYYTDYGLTLFIYNLTKKEYDILYNIPGEKQDAEGKFIKKFYNEIFSDQEFIDIIQEKSGKGLKISTGSVNTSNIIKSFKINIKTQF